MERDRFLEAARRSAEWIADYRERVEELPVLPRVEPGEVAARLPERAPEEGEPLEAVLADLDEVLLPGLTHWIHPGFHAYFPSTSAPPAALAEFLAAAVNQNAMLWRTSPAATELEERMVAWLRDLVGLPDTFSGVLQDTASVSSLVALLAARERLGVDVRRRGLAGRDDLGPLTLYVSEQAHSSLEKAAIAAGLGREQVRKVATDDAFRMDPDALAERMDRDRGQGKLPTMVCATVGTTSTASVDPPAEIAGVCGPRDVWLHVDAAYAGPAAMLPELRPRFDGWERADSVVINPHKWMAIPVDCSALLFRDPETVRASLSLTPAYLSTEEEATNLMDYGVALGRRFRALKLWFTLRHYGAEWYRSTLRDHVRWARTFADWVEEDPRFRLAAPPSFSTVCFQAVPPEGWRPAPPAAPSGGPAGAPSRQGDGDGRDRDDAFNARLLTGVNRKGPVFLSHTELEGSYALHLAVGGELTRERHLSELRDLLAATYRELAEAESG